MTILSANPRTLPNGTEPSAAQLAERIISLHQQLEQAPDLEPGVVTDAVFRDLVAACRPCDEERAEGVLSDPEIGWRAPRIRELCSDGEYRLERAWVRKIIAAGDPWACLDAFPYRDNYAALTRIELAALTGSGVDLGRVRRVCFLGGGPLPLSAVLLSAALPVPVDVVDHDVEAVDLATRLCRRLAISSVHIHNAEAAGFEGLADCDLVVLAALVGSSQYEKRAVLRSLHAAMRPGSVLVIRSAYRLRTLLYPPVDVQDLPGWRPLTVVHPLTDVVNSVVVAARGDDLPPAEEHTANPGQIGDRAGGVSLDHQKVCP